ncbi:uncharacterized protein LOC111252884 isoform X2 [Varroa destructor]|uniref:Uncharacterized protein n=1 Tax=Varroa destructor TaxID=109461 RepID=A0A7M7MCZ0_VARDE|nr:uncharacterized protein LOC111252884 isoform X2 [Varroa destructor]
MLPSTNISGEDIFATQDLLRRAVKDTPTTSPEKINMVHTGDDNRRIVDHCAKLKSAVEKFLHQQRGETCLNLPQKYSSKAFIDCEMNLTIGDDQRADMGDISYGEDQSREMRGRTEGHDADLTCSRKDVEILQQHQRSSQESPVDKRSSYRKEFTPGRSTSSDVNDYAASKRPFQDLSPTRVLGQIEHESRKRLYSIEEESASKKYHKDFMLLESSNGNDHSQKGVRRSVKEKHSVCPLNNGSSMAWVSSTEPQLIASILNGNMDEPYKDYSSHLSLNDRPQRCSSSRNISEAAVQGTLPATEYNCTSPSANVLKVTIMTRRRLQLPEVSKQWPKLLRCLRSSVEHTFRGHNGVNLKLHANCPGLNEYLEMWLQLKVLMKKANSATNSADIRQCETQVVTHIQELLSVSVCISADVNALTRPAQSIKDI